MIPQILTETQKSRYPDIVEGIVQLYSQNPEKLDEIMLQHEEHMMNPHRNTISEYTGSPELFMDITNFVISGMGLSGSYCGSRRVSHFDTTFKAVKHSALTCRRVQCPKCYTDWIIQRTFHMTVELERKAYLRKERPFSAVFSMNPQTAKKELKTFAQVNRNIFQRGYHLSKKMGIVGGVSVFHPFRISKTMQDALRKYRKTSKKASFKGDVGFWNMIRENVLKLPSFYDYVTVSPHAHTICFGKNPSGNTTKKVIVRINGDNKPKRMKEIKNVVAYVRYILTHAGVINIDGKIVCPTRRYGICYNRSADDNFIPESVLIDINEKVADALGMKWTVDGGLEYVDDDREPDLHDWMPLYNLCFMMSGIRYITKNEKIIRYFELLEAYITMNNGSLPPPNVIEVPEGVVIVEEINKTTLEEIQHKQDEIWGRGLHD